MGNLSTKTIELLKKTIANPCLANSRELETHLCNRGLSKKDFWKI
jgi:hypothetical protein